MDVIEWEYLLALGILLVAIEIIFFSFFLFWIGVGFVIVAFISTFILFESPITQVALAFFIGLVLVFLLRKWSMNLVTKTQNSEEERVHKSGIGIVDNGLVKMDGTYWKCDDDLSRYSDGDRVEVVDIVNNRVILKETSV